MIKIKKTIETKQVDVVEDVICNKCGESCKVIISTCGLFNFEGLTGVKVTGGYGSQYIGDMNQYEFDLCEKCLIDFIQTFKIPAAYKEL